MKKCSEKSLVNTSFAESKIPTTLIKVGKNEQYKTVASAVEAARPINGTVVIEIAGGTYTVPDTIELTSADNNLVIRAKDGEKVTLSNAHQIAYSDFAKVTDTAILGRLSDPSAKDKILFADLKALGIDDFGQLQPCGMSIGISAEYSPILTYNDRYLTLAEYPNNGYLKIGEVIDNGSEGNFFRDIKFRVADDTRLKNWTNADDIWAFGFYHWDWAETIAPASINADGVVTSKTGYFLVEEGKRVKFFNLLEEIDMPGEYYIDRKTGILYIYPPKDFKEDEFLSFSVHNKNIFTLNGCENITFQGLRIEGTRQNGIIAFYCKSCVVDACEFTAIGKKAVCFLKSSQCVIENSYAHDLSSAGFYMSGGNLATLVKSENIITNCHVERFMQYARTYNPGIFVDGVGNTVSHCEINDAPHEAISYHGSYNIFEYNNIYRVCTDTSDCSAIYTGRRWNDRNNEIRYNYFHDITTFDTSISAQAKAVYLDDMHSCTFIYGNIFYKLPEVGLIGGGRDNRFENNIMLDSQTALRIDARGTEWFGTEPGSPIHNYLMSSPWQTELWKKTFPSLTTVLTDRTKEPVDNIVKDNLIYNTPAMEIDPLVNKNGIVEDAVTVTPDDFADYGRDFTLKESSDIFTRLPNFKKIPFKEIGRYDFEIINKWTLNPSES